MTGTASVARYFDGVAANWPRNYSGPGGMSERIAWFAQCLQAEEVVAPARLLDYGAGIDDLVTQRVANNIKVVNMSLGIVGNPGIDAALRAKANTMVSNGIVVVA